MDAPRMRRRMMMAPDSTAPVDSTAPRRPRRPPADSTR
jgi:hypothetical protein